MDISGSEEGEPDELHSRPRKRARLETSISHVMENGRHPAIPNGEPAPPTFLGSRPRYRRDEFIRLINQELRALGYSRAAATLEEESNIKLELPEVSALREAVRLGEWDEAVSVVRELPLGADVRESVAFMLFESKYLEALEQMEQAGALHCLREDLSRIPGHDTDLKRLANLLLCTSTLDLYQTSKWQASREQRRLRLLRELQGVLPPGIMVPERRLEVLVEQALQLQQLNCKPHNDPHAPVSLYTDFTCGPQNVPSHTVQVLMDHEHEVWHVQFSRRGHMLASASADGTLIIWDVVPGQRRVVRRHAIQGHNKEIPFLAWHPEDAFLATCSGDGQVKLWKPETGQLHITLSNHTKGVEAAAWLPDGDRLVTGGRDRRIFLVNVQGQVLKEWDTATVHDLIVTHDGRYMLMNTNTALSASQQHPHVQPSRLKIFDLTTYEEVPANLLGDHGGSSAAGSIMSMTASRQSQHLLLSLTNQELLGWPLQTLLSVLPFKLGKRASGTGEDEDVPICYQVYKGMDDRHSRLVMRACYGGIDDKFVLSGSNEGLVYMWHRDSGEVLHRLEGHAGPVNAVSWNPADPAMFASCSDDKSIHIWGLESDIGDDAARIPAPGLPASPMVLS